MNSSSPPKSRVSILVIDDSPNNLRLLMKVLGDQGYQVRPVTDGAMAITAAQLDPPDLILLDIKMPGMDGYDVCKHLKADPLTQAIPIIFLTVLDDIGDVVQGFAVGAVDYITKPVNTGELIARIENQVQLRSLQKKLSDQNQELKHLLEEYQRKDAALLESEDKFSKVFQRSPIPLSISTIPEGRYSDINEAFAQETGYKRTEVIGKTALELNFWVSLDDRSYMVQSLASQGYFRNFETLLRDKHGRVRNILLSGEIIHLDDSPYNLISAKDITDLKSAEMELAQRSEELTHTLTTLQETQSQLVESAKMAALGNLVAGVAHEINTPVGTALMMASTLENSTQTIVQEIAQNTLTQSSFQKYTELATEASQLILGNLNRAGELIQSFKQVAVDQTSLKVRRFVVKSYIEEVLNNLSSQLKQTAHRVTILGNETTEIQSSPGALSQIITNFVINSLTHGFVDGKPGHIQIQIREEVNTCVLEYKDDGIGIPPEHIGRVFEPFYTTARHKGGSGLGLHLVYNLVTKKLHGNIIVMSEVNQGTAFTIRLPFSTQELNPDQASTSMSQ